VTPRGQNDRVRFSPPFHLSLPKSARGRILVAAMLVIVLGLAGVGLWLRFNPTASIVAGKVPLDTATLVTSDVPRHVEPPAPSPSPSSPSPAAQSGGPRTGGRSGGLPAYVPPGEHGLWPPDGTPPGPAKPFSDAVDDSGGLQFVLVLGSDARSGNPEQGARADSIHILALDPKARRGTIVGIARDSWVAIPGAGMHKINDCLSIGGASLCVRTLREITGMPIQYYVLTAFEGFQSLVDAVGGVDAYVPYDMNEKNSGAFFQKGWHHMTGPKALSFSRNRHIPGGDLGRSENQGRLMLDALKKFRTETGSRADVERFVSILLSRVRVDMSPADAIRLAMLARVTAASDVRNVVAPGRAGTAGRASVVFLTDQAPALFRDVAADARADGSYGSLGPPPDTTSPDTQAPAPGTPGGGPPPGPSTAPSPSPSPALIPGLPIPPLLPGP
jgi:LCP family protein required for cell wall assembly